MSDAKSPAQPTFALPVVRRGFRFNPVPRDGDADFEVGPGAGRAAGGAAIAAAPKPRIVHVCETAKGGVATYLSSLHRAETQAGGSVCVLPRQQRHFLDEGMGAVLFDRRGRGAKAVIGMIRAMCRAVNATAPEIIFFHSFFSAFALVWARCTGVKARLVYSAHGWAVLRYPPDSFKARCARLVERRIGSMADVVINTSRNEIDVARANGYRGRHVLIENAVCDVSAGVRSDRFGPREGDRLDLLFVGRFDRQKGLDILCEAFACASARRPDLRLHIVGEAVVDGNGGRACLRNDQMIFHGWVKERELDAFYRSADALVVPSRWEGFGLVVAEAFRNGTPVLASDQGALPSLVTPGETGEIFPLEAEPLAELLSGLDRPTLRRMRPAARAAFERRFTLQRFGPEILGLYRDELARTPSREEMASQSAPLTASTRETSLSSSTFGQ